MLEGYSALSFIAGQTSKIKLGTMVTGVTYRHPGILIKTVTTLDVVSGGRAYLGIGAAWNEREAYAVSHVGFGMNPRARYEALAMYDRRDTNGTEIRAVAGNFLFSTGANEFAGRYTAGHFDIPVMKTTITVDNTVVVRDGVLQDVFG